MDWKRILVLLFVCASCTDAYISEDELNVSTAARLNYSSNFDFSPTKSVSSWPVRWIDIFIFDDDQLGSLDTYQHFHSPSLGEISLCSRSGNKRVVILGNYEFDTSQLSSVDCYSTLESISVDFVDDNPDYPFLSGETVFVAGSDECCNVTLRPLMSEIVLERISQSIGLKNIKVSLVDANCRADILRNDGFRPVEFYNTEPRPYSPWMKFYCYPNTASEEGIGSPFTKLVVQGEYAGRTVYYPISVNRPGFGWVVGQQGICRNVSYRMNLNLTSAGVRSPDDDINVKEAVEQGWITLHPGNIVTGNHDETVRIWVDVYPEETELVFSVEDMEDDRIEGLYDYEFDSDGKGVTLHLKKGGTGMFVIDAGPPVNDGFLVLVVIDP